MPVMPTDILVTGVSAAVDYDPKDDEYLGKVSDRKTETEVLHIPQS